MNHVVNLWTEYLVSGYSDQSHALAAIHLAESLEFAHLIVETKWSEPTGRQVPHLFHQFLETPANYAAALAYLELHSIHLDCGMARPEYDPDAGLPHEFMRYLRAVAAWMSCPG